MMYRMFFMALNFAPGLLCTLKTETLKTFKFKTLKRPKT